MTEMNFEIARFNMLEQQIRPWEILDQNCLKIMQHIPREEFVPAPYTMMSFSDTELPLKHNQTMLAPKIEAKILQAVQVKSTDNILEIGTGSGYLTALLAYAAKTVHSIDIYQDFIDSATTKLNSLEIKNVSFENTDINKFDLTDKQYDVIVLGGSVPKVADSLKQSLSNNGRLFAVCGNSPIMLATLYTRVSQDQWMEEILFETEIPALKNTQKKPAFIF
ncbi:MAG: protein-L-isoaspartate O-methyltransferase [Pseudomonadota bacterium]